MLLNFGAPKFLLIVLATTQLAFCDIVVNEVHLSIPKNRDHQITERGHIIRQSSKNIADESQRRKQIHTRHFLADAAHNVLKKLNSNQHTDKVLFH